MQATISTNDTNMSTTTWTRIEQFFQVTWYPVTLGLFLFPVICLLLGTFGFLVGIPITKWHAPIGFILSIICAIYLCKSWHARVVVTGLIGVILGTLFVVSSFTFEWMGDGFSYHKPAMIAMCEGWNPYWSHDQLAQNVRDGSLAMWVIPYPKATWIIGAQLYAATGNVDQVHIINMLFVFVTVPICFVAIRTVFNLSVFKSFLFSLILASNPVSLSQISIGYLDGILGSCLTVLFLSLAAYLENRNSRWFPFIVGSIVIATNAKFTGVVYVGLFLLIVLGAHVVIDRLYKRRFDRNILAVVGVAAILSIIVGINPYIQHIFEHRHPFHPIMVLRNTEEKVDFSSVWYSNDEFKNATRFQRFFFSYITPPHEIGTRSALYTIKPDELLTNRTTKSHGEINGFGEAFAIPLVFSLIMLPLVRKGNVWILIIAIWATVLVQPHNWWARYVPQLWIFPVIVLCALSAQFTIYPPIKKRFDWIVYFMVFLFLAASWASLQLVLKVNKNIRKQAAQFLSLNTNCPGHLHFELHHPPYASGPCFRLYYETLIREAFPGALLVDRHGSQHSLDYVVWGYCRVSYSPDEQKTLHRILTRHASETLLVSVKDEASSNLSEVTKQFFHNAGGSIDQLKFRNAYVAIIQRGKIVEEKIDDNTCELQFRDPKTGRLFHLVSTGGNGDSHSSIRINGMEYSPNNRGLNIVIVNTNDPPISYSFDTHVEPDPFGTPHIGLSQYQVIKEMMNLRLRQLQNVWMPQAP